VVAVDFAPHISKRGCSESESPIDRISGVFMVAKPPSAIENKTTPKELGAIEIDVSCKYGPEFEFLAPKRCVFNECIGPTPVDPDLQNNQYKANSRSPCAPSKQTPKQRLAASNVDLSHLIEKTELLLQEMDLEVFRDAEKIKNEVEIRQIEQKVGVRTQELPAGTFGKAKRQTDAHPKSPLKLRSNEVELELVRAQRNMLRGAQSPTSINNDLNSAKISEMFAKAEPQRLCLRLDFDRFEVESSQFQKPLAEHISFIKIELGDQAGQTVEVFK
jgi:hypothetical protein